MTNSEIWHEKYLTEIQAAETARLNNNEGKARVCARRAIGALIADYYSNKGVAQLPVSAYELIQLMQSDPETPIEIRQRLSLFMIRVTTDFALPDDINLIAEAKVIEGQLEKLI